VTAARPTRKYDGWPYVVVGFYWEQRQPGEWGRYLVRRYARTGQLNSDELVFVEQDDQFTKPFCMHCLSQHLEPLPHDLYQWWHCNDCHLDFRIVSG